MIPFVEHCSCRPAAAARALTDIPSTWLRECVRWKTHRPHTHTHTQLFHFPNAFALHLIRIYIYARVVYSRCLVFSNVLYAFNIILISLTSFCCSAKCRRHHCRRLRRFLLRRHDTRDRKTQMEEVATHKTHTMQTSSSVKYDESMFMFIECRAASIVSLSWTMKSTRWRVCSCLGKW